MVSFVRTRDQQALACGCGRPVRCCLPPDDWIDEGNVLLHLLSARRIREELSRRTWRRKSHRWVGIIGALLFAAGLSAPTPELRFQNRPNENL